MPTTRDGFTRVALRAADALAVAAAAFVAAQVASGVGVAGGALFCVGALIALQAVGLYARDAVVLRAAVLDELPRLLQALGFVAGAVALAGPTVGADSRGAIVAMLVCACLTVPTARTGVRALARRYTANERVLILGSGMIADLVASKIRKHPELGLDIIGCLDVVGEQPLPDAGSDLRHLGTLDDVERVIADERVGTVVIAFSAVPHDDLLDAIRRCKRLRVKINVVPRLFEVIGSRVELHDVEGLTLLGLRGPVRSRGALFAKRVMDVVGSVIGLVVLFPLLAVVAAAVKLTSRGPVLFAQERVGRNQRPFRILKFRSMVVGAEEQKADVLHLNEFVGPMFKSVRDPRITPVGRFIRATSLDELPQLVNVLRGEMSIVGPRPLVREESDAVLGWHRTRLDLVPGLTGPWQVMGRQHVPFDEMVKLDYLYVAEWSLWNDVKLVLRTIPVVLRRTGA